MKLSYLIKNMGGSIIPGLCLVTFAFGMDNPNKGTPYMENTDQVTHHNVKTIIEGHLKKNPDLLDSSKGKDVVVFLGNSGAGKSTTINILGNKVALQVDGFNQITLENPEDPLAMVIGEGRNSETFLPQYIQVGDLLLYDMPGFNDTRGTAKNLVNACFIKSIIENANSVRLVFVAGMGQINDDKGESLIKLSNKVKQLVPNKPAENFSGLIITKSHVSKIALPDFLNLKLELTGSLNPDLSIVSHWIEHQRIDQISMPTDGEIKDYERESIIRLIGEMGHEQVKNINIGVIYDATEQMKIEAIYDAEIEGIIEELISQNFQANALSSLSKGALETKKNYMLNDFNQCVSSSLEESPLIKLLHPISEGLYQSSWDAKKQSLALRVEHIVALINGEIAEKERQEEEARRIQAQNEVARLQAEAEAQRRRNDPSNEFAKGAKEIKRIWNKLF